MDPVSIIDQALTDTGLSEDEPLRAFLRSVVPGALRTLKQFINDESLNEPPAEPRETRPQLPAAPPARGSAEYDQYAGIPVIDID